MIKGEDFQKGSIVKLFDGRIGNITEKTLCADLDSGAIIKTGGYKIRIDFSDGNGVEGYLYSLVEQVIKF